MQGQKTYILKNQKIHKLHIKLYLYTLLIYLETHIKKSSATIVLNNT